MEHFDQIVHVHGFIVIDVRGGVCGTSHAVAGGLAAEMCDADRTEELFIPSMHQMPTTCPNRAKNGAMFKTSAPPAGPEFLAADIQASVLPAYSL